MQVVIRRFFCLPLLLVGLALPGLAQTSLSDIRPRLRPEVTSRIIAAIRADDWVNADKLAAEVSPLMTDLVSWHRLRAGQGEYGELQGFLARRADWPGLAYLRRRSEGVVAKQADPEVLAFFAVSPAQSPDGVLGHAAALSRSGKTEVAQKLVAEAWVSKSMSKAQQSQFLADHSEFLKKQHARRLDTMLWQGKHDVARRMFPQVGADQKALAEARIALQRRLKNVDTLIGKVPEQLQSHPGLTHDRFEWRLRKGRWDEAKAMLLAQSKSAEALGEPSGWANRRRQLARDELRDGSAKRAYQMASQHFLTTGSHYADLEWLSGYIALTKLKDPGKALQHFQNHDDAVRSPISQGRAGYWKGRALIALGRPAEADQEFTRGAAYQTSFYGLLAAEAAGLPFDVGLESVPQTRWQDSPLVNDSLFRIGQMLVSAGERNLAERFWTHLAEQLGEHDAALLGQAAIDMGEPHLAVMIGKAVARRGETVPVPYYALHPLAKAELPVSTDLALAIARRESEFDPVVVSGAGARGLMQLMPKTASAVAKDLGLSKDHRTSRLTSDPVYNARLGTAYLAELSETFDGSVVMVSAGYNAGPSRPERWMRMYGDPRGKTLDAMIDWIEGIPFRETRNYVMRVTESLPIYRARLGFDPLPIPFSQELLAHHVD